MIKSQLHEPHFSGFSILFSENEHISCFYLSGFITQIDLLTSQDSKAC